MTAQRSVGGIALRLTLSGALVISSLSGCANQGNMFATGADPNDACGREHAAFADSKDFYLQEVAQGALLGALGGAALGALTAASTGGNAGTGALIGAGVGGVAGGTAGYFNARQKQAADQTALANSVYGDVTKASQELDRVSTTFGNLRACRFTVAENAKAAFKAGTLPREQAAARLADQKKRFADELQLARQYGAKMDEQDQQYRFAADSLVKDDPEAQRLVATRSVALASGGPADLVATSAATLRSGPTASSSRLAAVEKGQGVYSTTEPAVGEWRKVALANGVTGYVSSKLVAPAGTPVSTAAAPAATRSGRSAQVAMAATETLPTKRAAYGKQVDDAAAQSNITFDLDQSA